MSAPGRPRPGPGTLVRLNEGGLCGGCVDARELFHCSRCGGIWCGSCVDDRGCPVACEVRR